MTREAFYGLSPVIRLSLFEFESIPVGRPEIISDCQIGFRWREKCWGRIRVRTFLGLTNDGPLISTLRPVVRVKAVSSLVPRPQVMA